jgi:hypothetical protein
MLYHSYFVGPTGTLILLRHFGGVRGRNTSHGSARGLLGGVGCCPEIGEVLRATSMHGERSQAEGCSFPFIFQLDDRRNTACGHWYADDGRIGGDNPDLIQSYLDKFLELFAVVGLQVNAIKTVSMTSSPNFRWPAHTIGAYSHRLSGEPVMYQAREMVLEECEVCGKSMQHRSLKRHVTDQHTQQN